MSQQLSVMGYPISRTGYLPKSIQAGIAVKQALAGSADAPDYWLRVIVARYLEKFYRDRKNGHPSAEELPYAIGSWVEDIGYNLNQEQDAERVIRGFMLLSRNITRWPQPAELLKCLPGRNSPKSPFRKGGQGEFENADIDTSADGEKLQAILDMLERGGDNGEKTTD